jgi:hypothetical protein
MSKYDINNQQSDKDIMYGLVTILVIVINFIVVGVV